MPDQNVGKLRIAPGGEDADALRHDPEDEPHAPELQADAERKHTEIMATINEQRSVLEGRIEQLKTFEREYRVRLKSYLESQLEELENRSSALPVDNGSDSFNQDNQSSGYSQSYAKGNN